MEIVPRKRDPDGPCTTEYDSGDCSDWSADVHEEILQQIKHEPDDVPVCCVSVTKIQIHDLGQLLRVYSVGSLYSTGTRATKVR